MKVGCSVEPDVNDIYINTTELSLFNRLYWKSVTAVSGFEPLRLMNTSYYNDNSTIIFHNTNAPMLAVSAMLIFLFLLFSTTVVICCMPRFYLYHIKYWFIQLREWQIMWFLFNHPQYTRKHAEKHIDILQQTKNYLLSIQLMNMNIGYTEQRQNITGDLTIHNDNIILNTSVIQQDNQPIPNMVPEMMSIQGQYREYAGIKRTWEACFDEMIQYRGNNAELTREVVKIMFHQGLKFIAKENVTMSQRMSIMKRAFIKVFEVEPSHHQFYKAFEYILEDKPSF